jgi:hypothetical protein
VMGPTCSGAVPMHAVSRRPAGRCWDQGPQLPAPPAAVISAGGLLREMPLAVACYAAADVLLT